MALHRILDCTGVATFGAPADPEHVIHLPDPAVTQLEEMGHTEVSTGGRPAQFPAIMLFVMGAAVLLAAVIVAIVDVHGALRGGATSISASGLSAMLGRRIMRTVARGACTRTTI